MIDGMNQPQTRPIVHRSPIPGFALSAGVTVTILSLVVLLPIGALLWKGVNAGFPSMWQTVNTERTWQALFLSG